MKSANFITKGISCLLLLFLVACSKEDDIKPSDIATTIYNDSKVNIVNVVGTLTGKHPIEPGYYLPGRAVEADKIKVRTYLKSLIESLCLEPMEQNYLVNSGGTNIYSTLPATIKTTEYIIIGAHYDSQYGTPGASDNATGVAAILGIINNLKKVPIRNKNIMFVFFDDEEIGLVGSKQFALKILSEDLDVHSVHTVDQLGWDNDGDRAIELERPTDSLKAIYQAAALESNIPVHITNTSSTDHTSFRIQGFPAIGLTEEFINGDTSPYYHQPGDTYETVNFEYLISSTNLISKVISKMIS